MTNKIVTAELPIFAAGDDPGMPDFGARVTTLGQLGGASRVTFGIICREPRKLGLKKWSPNNYKGVTLPLSRR